MAKRITYNIDWMQYGCDWPDWLHEWPIDPQSVRDILRTFVPHLYVKGQPYERPDSDKPNGMHGYNRTYDYGYATIHVNPDRRDMKAHVRMTGSECGAWRDLGGVDDRLVQFVRGVGGQASRIDLAFDLFDYGIDLMRIYKDWKGGKVECRARKVTPVVSGVMDDKRAVVEAATVYFGSRTSDVMVRMYDKGKEQRTDLDWTRVELEIKGDKAKAYLIAMDANGIAETGRAILADYFYKMPYAFWRDILKGEIVPLPTVGRKVTERQAWLRNVVFPLLRDEIANEWDGVEETGITREIESMIRDNWRTRSLAIRKQYGAWD